jgi:hypothetical protein
MTITVTQNQVNDAPQPHHEAAQSNLAQQIPSDAGKIFDSLNSIQRQFLTNISDPAARGNALFLSAFIMGVAPALYDELIKNPFDSNSINKIPEALRNTPFVAEAIAMGDPKLLEDLRSSKISEHLTLNQVDAVADRVVKLKGAMAECSADDARKPLNELFDILKNKVIGEVPPNDALVRRETYLYLIRATRMISEAQGALDQYASGDGELLAFLAKNYSKLQGQARLERISGAVIVHLADDDFRRVSDGAAAWVVRSSKLGCLSGRVIFAPYNVSESTLRHEYEHVLFNNLFTTEPNKKPTTLSVLLERVKNAGGSIDGHQKNADFASFAAAEYARNELAAYSTSKGGAATIGALGFDKWLDSFLPLLANLIDTQPLSAEQKCEIYSLYADRLKRDVCNAHFENSLLSYRGRVTEGELEGACSEDMVTALFQVMPDEHPEQGEFLSRLIAGKTRPEISQIQEGRGVELSAKTFWNSDVECREILALAPASVLTLAIVLWQSGDDGLGWLGKQIVQSILPRVHSDSLKALLEASPIPEEIPSSKASPIDRRRFEVAVQLREEISKYICDFEGLMPLKVSLERLCGENKPLNSEDKLKELTRLMSGQSQGTWRRAFPVGRFLEACRLLSPELIISVGGNLTDWCSDPGIKRELNMGILYAMQKVAQS